MYQVCSCPDKQCSIHGEPVPYTLTTSSTDSTVFSGVNPPKEKETTNPKEITIGGATYVLKGEV